MEPKQRPVFAVFGGTFNPVHEGHVGIVEGLLATGEVDRVFVVPAARNPFKGGEELLPGPLRLAMVERAMGHLHRVSVLDLEMRRDRPSYTVETVAALASTYPAATFKLAIGWDVFLQFPDWRNAEAILEQAGLLVILRKGQPPPAKSEGKAWLKGLPQAWQSRVRAQGKGRWRDDQGRVVLEFLNLRLPGYSSSGIRAGRNLRHVPAAARELLSEFWRTTDAS
jgi:nicotinate-nucleotide adenylyltransferase